MLLALIGFVAVTLFAGSQLGAGDAKQKDLVETIDAAAELKTLFGALGVAELKEVLTGEGPFTVFAPTDDAFSALGSGTVKNLVAAQKYVKPFKKITKDDGHLHAILTYHVVKGKLQRKDLLALAKEGKTLETVNGARITLALDGDKIKVNGAVVAKTDLVAKNGIIHVIDAVLLPPAPTLNIEGRKRVPACPPADEPLIWQRTITLASPKSDRERLVALWKRAAEQTPPIGDKGRWDARVGELVKLAENYAGEKDQQKAADAASALVQQANCIGCHTDHQKTPFSRPR
jgi:uncharacterized surface protein with fasciclin (FAS1) repeats